MTRAWAPACGPRAHADSLFARSQVEHHLFPAMPQFQHKHISPRVRAFFEAHGLVYDVRPYFSCLRQTLANLHAVGHSTKDD